MWCREVSIRHTGRVSLPDIESIERVSGNSPPPAPRPSRRPQVWVIEDKDLARPPVNPICEDCDPEKDWRVNNLLKLWLPPINTEELRLRGSTKPLQTATDDAEIAAAAFTPIQHYDIIPAGGAVSTHGGMSWDLAEDRPPTPQGRQTPSRLIKVASALDGDDSSVSEQEKLKVILEKKEQEADERREKLLARRRRRLNRQNEEVVEHKEKLHQKKKQYVETKKESMSRRDGMAEMNRELMTTMRQMKRAEYNRRVQEQGQQVQNDRFFNELLEEEGITIPSTLMTRQLSSPPDAENVLRRSHAQLEARQCNCKQCCKKRVERSSSDWSIERVLDEEEERFSRKQSDKKSKKSAGGAALGEKSSKKGKKKSRKVEGEDERKKSPRGGVLNSEKSVKKEKESAELEKPPKGRKGKKSKKAAVGLESKKSSGSVGAEVDDAEVKGQPARRRSFWSKLKAFFCGGKPRVDD